MGIFNRHQSRDILFLIPVHLEGEKLSKTKIRMMYCDASGKVYSTTMNRSVYQLAREIADKMEATHKPFAIVGRETTRGDFLPVAVEIDSKEEQALEYILDHAMKSGKLPDILKKYLKPIIKRGQESPELLPSSPRPKP